MNKYQKTLAYLEDVFHGDCAYFDVMVALDTAITTIKELSDERESEKEERDNLKFENNKLRQEVEILSWRLDDIKEKANTIYYMCDSEIETDESDSDNADL